MQYRITDHEAWPARAILLATIGAIFGVLFDFTLSEGAYRWTESPLRISAASFLVVFGIAFAITLERTRWLWSLLVAALVFYWNGSPNGWTSGDEWRVVAIALAIGIAAPLFQSARDAGARRFDPAEVHAHAWTNIVLWFASCAFVLISYLLAQLLAELFHLIGIDILREALRESAFNFALLGGALGGAIALLRERDKILGLLQRVVTTVLSVLAPVLAVGLVLFVVALPFVGLAPLWETTRATTPILLIAVAGAFFLANAVIGNTPEDEAKARVLRLSALGLACVMTPLAAVAAVSTWLRIDQHGFTPERLWALVFVLVVLGVALTYLWTVIRGRGAWSARVRPANVRLAMAICAIAVLLATPLINFGAISARDQLARLQSGRTSPEEFDWAALRFDFGPEGRRALERLAKQGSSTTRSFAASALISEQRWTLDQLSEQRHRARELTRKLRVLPRQVPVPPPLREALARDNACSGEDCTLLWDGTAPEAIAITFGCPNCPVSTRRLFLDRAGQWSTTIPGLSTTGIETRDSSERNVAAERRAVAAGRVEVRQVTKRQLFIDGKPVGELMD
jgi:hypothetical protein